MSVYQRFPGAKVETFVTELFQSYGFTTSDSETAAAILLAADLHGIESHGVQRIQMYATDLKKGTIQVGAQPQIVFETPLSAVVDGQQALGLLTGKSSMDVAIAKAQTSGIGLVTVRNSNHYGIAGYYAQQAAEVGLIGLSLTNSIATMVPTHAKEPFLGTNPIAFAMPAKEDRFLFDGATTLVSYGKVELYRKEKQAHPQPWTLRDVDRAYPEEPAGLAPLGGFTTEGGSHKGYGLGLIVEILTAILSQGTPSHQVGAAGGTCHFFVALDPQLFGAKEQVEAHLATYLSELRALEPRGAEPVLVPGDPEAAAYERLQREGIKVYDETRAELLALATQQGLSAWVEWLQTAGQSPQ